MKTRRDPSSLSAETNCREFERGDLVVAVIIVTPRKSVTHILLHETRHWAQIGAMLRMAGHKGDFHDFLFCPAMGGIVRRDQGTATAPLNHTPASA